MGERLENFKFKKYDRIEDVPHGLNGYSNLGCRCKICTNAHRISHHRYMLENPEQLFKQRLREHLKRGGSKSDFNSYCPECDMPFTEKGLARHRRVLHGIWLAPEHGVRRYGRPWNCRCDICKAASNEYRKSLRHKKAQREKGGVTDA